MRDVAFALTSMIEEKKREKINKKNFSIHPGDQNFPNVYQVKEH